jgi:uncharacterized protein YigA (DUF484 family)
MSTQGITEDDIANFLLHTPGFFERHAELLASVQLTSPHGQRAVSLQERQMEMLREKNRGLELRLMEMLRHGQENVAIADKLLCWIRAIMLNTDAASLPGALVEELRHQFLIPQAAIRVWGVSEALGEQPFAQAVSEDARRFASSLSLPYCGANTGFEAAGWFEDPASVVSLALLPLRHGTASPAFGMLALGSPDPTRYSADMGTEFLVRIAEIASAGLHRLLPPA